MSLNNELIFLKWMSHSIYSFDIICLRTATLGSRHCPQLVFGALSDENEHYYPLWPPSFLPSLCARSHTRYRNHFLRVASFRCTPDYSHCCSSPHHFFPSFSSPLNVWRFSSPVYFSVSGFLPIHPTLPHPCPSLNVMETCAEKASGAGITTRSWWHWGLHISFSSLMRRGCQHQACKN